MKIIIKKIIFFIHTKYRLLRDKTIKSKTVVHPRIKLAKYVMLGENLVLHKNLSVDVGTFIGDYTRIERCNSIGKYCSISHGVKIGLGSHPLDYVSTSPLFYSKYRCFVDGIKLSYEQEKDGYTVIENDVWIGANVLIMAGVKIGTGSVIAAGSVVTRDVPPYAIVAGVPATILKYRFDADVIEKFLSDKWWEKDLVYLKGMNSTFSNVNEYFQAIDKGDNNEKNSR